MAHALTTYAMWQQAVQHSCDAALMQRACQRQERQCLPCHANSSEAKPSQCNSCSTSRLLQEWQCGSLSMLAGPTDMVALSLCLSDAIVQHFAPQRMPNAPLSQHDFVEADSQHLRRLATFVCPSCLVVAALQWSAACRPPATRQLLLV